MSLFNSPPFSSDSLKKSLSTLKSLGTRKYEELSERVDRLRRTYDAEMERDRRADELHERLAKLKEAAIAYRATHPGMPTPYSLASALRAVLQTAALSAEEKNGWLKEYTTHVAPEDWEDVTKIEELPYSPGETFTQHQIRERAEELRATGYRPWVKVSSGARYLYPVLHPLNLLAFHEDLLSQIWNELPLSAEIKERRLLPALVYLAEHASSLPASEGNHDYEPAGLFAHSLATLLETLRAAISRGLVSARCKEQDEPLWYLLIMLALTHDLGKVQTDFTLCGTTGDELTGYDATVPITLIAGREGDTLSLTWRRERGASHKSATLAYRKALLKRIFPEMTVILRDLIALDLLLSCETVTEAKARAKARNEGLENDDPCVRMDNLAVAFLAAVHEGDRRAVDLSRLADGRGLGDHEIAFLRLNKVLTERFLLPRYPELKDDTCAKNKNPLRRVPAVKKNPKLTKAEDSSGASKSSAKESFLNLDHALPFLKVALPEFCTNALFVFYGCALYESLLSIRDQLCQRRGAQREQLTNVLRRLGMVYQVGPTQALGWFEVHTGGKALGYVYGVMLKIDTALFESLEGTSFQLRFIGTHLPAAVRISAGLLGPGAPDPGYHPYICDLRQASRTHLTPAEKGFFKPVLHLFKAEILIPLQRGQRPDGTAEIQGVAEQAMSGRKPGEKTFHDPLKEIKASALPQGVAVTDRHFILFRYTRLDDLLRNDREKERQLKQRQRSEKASSRRKVKELLEDLDRRETTKSSRRCLSEAEREKLADTRFVDELLDDMQLES